MVLKCFITTFSFDLIHFIQNWKELSHSSKSGLLTLSKFHITQRKVQKNMVQYTMLI